MMRFCLVAAFLLGAAAIPLSALADTTDPRPLFLVDTMKDSPLKQRLAACEGQPMQKTLFSISHRGAPLMFPEHTVESARAASRMGAGIIECDVTFTKDKELVCRHAQNDLHTSTNILATDLAAKCTAPFTPAAGDVKAAAECRTSDLTLDEFHTLKGKMDGADLTATTVEAYMKGTAPWRTDLYATETGTLMTHAEYIALIQSLGSKFTPELKTPTVEMPFDGFTQQAYAQKMIDDYKAAGVPASDVWAQSFLLDDVLYWIKAEPEFGKQAVFLVDADKIEGFDNMKPETWGLDLVDLKARGLNYIAPQLYALVTLEEDKIVPSAFAKAIKASGLKIITWSLERSGPLNTGGGGYYKSITAAVTSDGAMYELVDVLAQDVGVVGLFSDWPGTVSYYANCVGLK